MQAKRQRSRRRAQQHEREVAAGTVEAGHQDAGDGLRTDDAGRHGEPPDGRREIAVQPALAEDAAAGHDRGAQPLVETGPDRAIDAAGDEISPRRDLAKEAGQHRLGFRGRLGSWLRGRHQNVFGQWKSCRSARSNGFAAASACRSNVACWPPAAKMTRA